MIVAFRRTPSFPLQTASQSCLSTSTNRGWSADGLVAGMAVVSELNAAVKGAAVDAEYALEKAVMDLVAARHRR